MVILCISKNFCEVKLSGMWSWPHISIWCWGLAYPHTTHHYTHTMDNITLMILTYNARLCINWLRFFTLKINVPCMFMTRNEAPWGQEVIAG
jgi:hypothetical protein